MTNSRHSTYYIKNIKPITLCGRTIMLQINVNGAFTLPFDVLPTEGEHNFNVCEKCQNTLEGLRNYLTRRFQGLEGTQPFPYCCQPHAQLVNYDEFLRSKDFFHAVPEMAARKVIYMNQHICNNIDKENWYEEITNYMDYIVESFGQNPNDAGEPLYLSHFFSYVSELMKSNKEISSDKKNRIQEFIDSYKVEISGSNKDIKNLISTYEKWLEIFPFKLKAYFGDLKRHFESRLPIFTGRPQMNPYSGNTKISIRSKKGLISYLNELTNTLITKVNVTELIDGGLILNVNRHQIELANEELRVSTMELTNAFSKREKQYLVTLKKWLALHKKYFDEITPLLKEVSSPSPTGRIVDP